MNTENIDEVINALRVMGGPAPPLNPPSDGARSGGMDPWQQSVEKRLDSLDGRAQRLEAAVSDVRTNLATLTERVTHLPGKGFVVAAGTGTVAALTGILILLQRLGIMH